MYVSATAVVSGSFLSGQCNGKALKPNPFGLMLNIDAGSMMGLSALVIPVFLDTIDDGPQLLRQWARLYHYGSIIMPALCVATCGIYGYVALSKRTAISPLWSPYALAAVSTLAMVPFTLWVMVPTNNALFELHRSEGSTELDVVQVLVVKWAWLHVMRSLYPLFGAFLGFRALIRELRT
jgi:hypothetical protein